jgi:hypothetical protein
MAGLAHDGELGHAVQVGLGAEAGAQGVTGVGSGIETGAAGSALNDPGRGC